MKKIGFLSFGHWSNHPAYKTRTVSDALLQSIDLAVAAEEIGLDVRISGQPDFLETVFNRPITDSDWRREQKSIIL
jgi:hypothetical protein